MLLHVCVVSVEDVVVPSAANVPKRDGYIVKCSTIGVLPTTENMGLIAGCMVTENRAVDDGVIELF